MPPKTEDGLRPTRPPHLHSSLGFLHRFFEWLGDALDELLQQRKEDVREILTVSWHI